MIRLVIKFVHCCDDILLQFHATIIIKCFSEMNNDLVRDIVTITVFYTHHISALQIEYYLIMKHAWDETAWDETC